MNRPATITGSEQHPPTACWSCGADLPQPSKRAQQSTEVCGCDESKQLRATMRETGVVLRRVAELMTLATSDRHDLAAALLALADSMASIPGELKGDR